MNVVRWNPFREFDDLFVRSGLHSASPETVRATRWVPKADIFEHRTGYRIELELPAVSPEQVKVDLQDGVLTVAGERSASFSASDDEETRIHRLERLHGQFERKFSLPKDADPESVAALSKDGVLSIEIARLASVQPKSIEVQSA